MIKILEKDNIENLTHSIQLMDSSIRDGGNVNEWNFGKRTIHGIISNLVKAQIDYVELGYLKNCETDDDHTLYKTVGQAEKNALIQSDYTEYSLMVQVDKWNWDNLETCKGRIRNIRVSFHKIRTSEGIDLCKRVMEKGYICHCNPINIMGYTDGELLELLKEINDLHPQVFSIVDTFGSMSLTDIKRISMILDNNLLKDIKIAAHLHENMGLAFALAIEFINQFNGKRDIIIDASLYGIGRVPGNLCIELIAGFLNQEYGKNYYIDYIYDAIDDYIANIKAKNPWGYELAYALSGFYNLHRTYAEFLLEQGRLKTKDIRSILECIPTKERVIYNKEYIKNAYRDYICQSFEDSEYIQAFGEQIKDKSVVIIAPGASLLTYMDDVNSMLTKENTIVISVNFIPNNINTDILFFTNKKRVSQYLSYIIDGMKIAVTSNLIDDVDEADYVFNYSSLITYDNFQIEDSVLTLLHLINDNFKGTTCYIAGYDNILNSRKHIDESMELAHSIQIDRKKILSALSAFCNLKINFFGKSK